jgi:hypothetical protein
VQLPTFAVPISVQVTVIALTVTTVPVQVLQVASGRYYWRVVNASAAGGGNLWCSKSDPAPAPNKPGCYMLPPGGYEEYAANFVPANPLYVVSDGTAAATIEHCDG